MGYQDNTSMDTAIRPSQAMLPLNTKCVSPRFRAPEEQAEIDRRVVIYARQVEEAGRITWLPHKGDGESA